MDITALVHVFNAVSDRAADIAVTALWQGALLAGTLTLCLRVAPRVSASYRFTLWATAFVVLTCLSVFSLIPEATRGISAGVAGNVARPWFSVDARWSVAIAALWLTASLFRAADLAIHSVRLRKLWKASQPVQLNDRVESLLAATAAESGRGPVEVCTTTTLQRPSVIGFFKPRILIPDWLYGRLTQGELEQIVLHEAQHLSRRDDWTNLVQKLCLMLFPLNPALVWIERRLCREREMACDDGVIRVTGAPRAYAACLTSLAERGLERRVEALSLGAWQRRPELVHRVHSILRSKGRLNPVGARVLLGTLGCGLLAGSVELAKSPQLVAFVPERSSLAASAVENPNVAKTAKEIPVQVALLENQIPGSHGIRAIPSLASARNGTPVATNFTLRVPGRPQHATVAQNAAVPVMAATAERPATKSALNEFDKQNAQNQQWIVLTEWEQVETSNDNSAVKRDYDADATAARSDGAPESPVQRPGSRITVTQLIFRILPANVGSKSATKPAASSSTIQPGPATFRDGWLVLQL